MALGAAHVIHSSSLGAALSAARGKNSDQESEVVLIHVPALTRLSAARASSESDPYLGLFPELFPVDPLHLDLGVGFLVGGALREEGENNLIRKHGSRRRGKKERG